jgi:hypothetical protein
VLSDTPYVESGKYAQSKVDLRKYDESGEPTVTLTTTTGATDIPDVGGAVKVVPQADGRFKISFKDAGSSTKIAKFIDCYTEKDESTGAETEVKKLVDEFANGGKSTWTKTYNVEQGHTYYFYITGSKVCIYSMSIDYRDAIAWDSLATPVLGTPIVDSNNGTIKVPFYAQVGNRYADSLEIRMLDSEGNLVNTVSYVDYSDLSEESYAEFEPSASGEYTFSAVLTRSGEAGKTSNSVNAEKFILPMSKPIIIDEENQGSGAIRFSWNEVSEASSYNIYLDGNLVATTTSPVYRFTGLTVGQEYEFGVEAVGNGYTSELATAKQTVTNEAKKTWQTTIYGSSSSTDEKNGGVTPGSDSNNPTEGASIWSLNGKGKLVPNSTDGVTFYYTTIDPETENFTFRQ